MSERPGRRRDFVLLLLATLTALCNFAPLLSVVPLWAAAGGGTGTGVGATTGAMMAATALTQLSMGPVLRRFTLRQIFVIGALIMAVPTPFYLLSDQLGPVLVVSAVRGIGFGLVVVSASALVAEIVPARQLARGLGIHGLATGLPMVAALPLAVWVVQQWSFTPVFLGATALTVVGMGLAALLSVGGESAQERPGPATGAELLGEATDADRAGRAKVSAFRRWFGQAGSFWALGPLLRPALVFFTLTMALGSVTTFLPLAMVDAATVSLALFVLSLAMIVGRFGAGVLGGHLDPGRLVLPGALAGAAGMTGVVLGTVNDHIVWPAVVGAAIFGLGLGSAQNDALVTILHRAGPGRHGLASTVWNFAYDAGIGTGSVLFGAVLTGLDYPWAFALAVGVILAAAPAARRALPT